LDELLANPEDDAGLQPFVRSKKLQQFIENAIRKTPTILSQLKTIEFCKKKKKKT
jgi:hypothetical protein